LSDCDRVVLQAEHATIVEHRDASRVVVSWVVRLRLERLVILANIVNAEVWIRLGNLVPKGELAFTRSEIRGENAPIVV
jgi:hypothetical protein